MDQPEPKTELNLPGSLKAQFQALETALWKVESVVAFGLGFGALLLSLLLSFVSDRLWETPSWLRILVALAGWLVCLWAIVAWCRRWLLSRRTPASLASLVQTRYRRLGDRLLGIVELADESRRPAHFSAELYHAAIQQVANEAQALDFPAAVDRAPSRRSWVFLAILCGVAAAFAMVVPQAAYNAFLRWVRPSADLPRHTLVELRDLPNEVVVPHGEPFTLSLSVNYRSAWHPGTAVCQLPAQRPIESAVREGRVTFQIPPQTQAGRLRVRLGDARSFVSVRPLLRPSLVDLKASVELPAYLNYPIQTESVRKGLLSVVEGAKVSFQGTATRELAAADFASETSELAPLKVEGPLFSTNGLDLSAADWLAFRWKDAYGLTNSAPWRLAVRREADAAPVTEIIEQPREIGVLETELLTIKARAADDFGIRNLGLVFDLDSGATNKQVRYNLKSGAPAPTDKKWEHTFKFSPALWKIPADTVLEMRAYASDYFPGRPSSESSVYHVFVLGNTKHAEMVRQQLDSVLARLEEVSRQEEKIAADTAAAQTADAAGAKVEDKLAALAEEQARNASLLEQLSREGMKTLREAIRNPAFSEQSIGDWAKSFQEMNSLSKNSMSRAASSLSSARKNQPTRQKEVADALQNERDALKVLEKLQQNVNEGLDQLQALTLAERLRNLGSKEKEIAELVRKNVPETIGMMPNELPDRFRDDNQRFASRQTTALDEARALQAEIGRFFERARRPAYGQVVQEMKEAKTTEGLESLRGLIQDNISMGAMTSLTDWSGRFAEWAKKLEPPASASAGGGEGQQGQGGKTPTDAMKQLVALLRLRESQVVLKEQTGLVEKSKEDPEAYASGAALLATREDSAKAALDKVVRDLPIPGLEQLFSKTLDSMETVASLLKKPQTDDVVQGRETETIDLLSDAINFINELAQRQSGQQEQSAAQDMAFLMQAMRQQGQSGPPSGTGSNPGLNSSGGQTSKVPSALDADAGGRDGDARNINRAAGATENLPAEFRDALQSYFNEIDRGASR